MATNQLLCRYFAQGICSFGEACIYSHDPENSIPIPEEVCLFYLRSTCYKGDCCTKTHKSIEELLTESNVLEEEGEVLQNSVCLEDSVYSDTYSEEVSSYVPDSFPSTSSWTNIPLEEVEVFQPVNDSCESAASCESVPALSDGAHVKLSYASVASSSQPKDDFEKVMATKELCSFYESNGFCITPKCNNVHGNWCDLCSFYSLHPYNATQSDLHRQECVRLHEKNMEESFAYQRSKDLTCGICLDVIMDKDSRKDRRFGILENCLHVYCIECIRTWRNSNFDKKNKRGCPQCRIKSHFIIPSEYFYDEKEDKVKLINEYKDALSKQHCKYFKQGQGKCPFEGACFYKHEYPDGRKAELPMPSERRRIKGGSGQIEEYAALLSLFMDMDNLTQILSDGDFDIMDYEDILFEDSD